MKRSTDRILTTHTGRLDPPSEVRDMQRGPEAEKNMASDAYKTTLQQSITDIVKRQRDIGIDVVSDGELGKVNSFPYYSRRMSGLKVRPVREGEPPGMWERTGERQEFAEFYEYLGFRTARERMFFDGPISYIGEAEVQRDIDMAKAGIEAAGGRRERRLHVRAGARLAGALVYNEYYKTDEEYLFAIAEAMHDGVQGDRRRRLHPAARRPGPAGHLRHDRAHARASRTTASFAELRVEAHEPRPARACPSDRVRYHICWGSWHGPHTHDLAAEARRRPHAEGRRRRPTRSRRRTRGTSTSGRSGRTTKLPEGKILIPGVVSHASNVVEHPELVADRIVQYAELVGTENVHRRHGLRHGRPRAPPDRLGEAGGAGRRRAHGDEAALGVEGCRGDPCGRPCRPPPCS